MDRKITKKKLGPRMVTVAIILMAVGFIFLIQPLSLTLYSISFTILLLGVILINVFSHI